MRSTADETTAACQCARCRAHAAGLGPGPYSPAEYQLIAPPVVVSPGDDSVGSDPAVIAAERARDEARAAFDTCDELWLAAVAEHRSADLLGQDPYVRNADGDPVGVRQGPRTDAGRIAELASAELEAREHRSRAWAAVVKANDRIVAAQLQARMRAVEAARNGRSGNRGRR